MSIGDLLPEESRVKACLSSHLAQELELARDLLSFGVMALKSASLDNSSLSHDSVVTVVGLYVKVTVTFRAILHLSESGFDRSALPLSRSLYESCLNLVFLVRHRVSLFHFNDSKSSPKTPLQLHGKTLTPSFRTALYNAWCVLWDEKDAESWKRTPGLRRAGKRVFKKLMNIDNPYVDQIGPAWEKWIRGKNTCVGLSIADFAASLGRAFRTWHRSVYAGDSKSVHQSDMLDYLDLAEEDAAFQPRWFTSPDSVRDVLHRAATIYLCCIEEMHKRFDFGVQSGHMIHRFAARLNRV